MAGAMSIHGCPNCGGSTMLLGMRERTTVRKCRTCATVVRHTPPNLPPGNHGYSKWDPEQVLSAEFGSSNFPTSEEDVV